MSGKIESGNEPRDTSPCKLTWRATEGSLRLIEDEVHLWRIPADRAIQEVESLGTFLSPAEHERANRYVFARDRQRFVVRRAALRQILSQYLGLPPHEVAFSQNPLGKPFLANEAAATALRFSQSHSAGLSLVALVIGREIGVDVESSERPLTLGDLGHTALCAEEYRQISHLPLPEHGRALLKIWTRKEAILKALGTGLSIAPNRVHVTCLPGENAAVLSIDDGRRFVDDWSMIDVSISPQFAATLAVDGPIGNLQGWTWEPLCTDQ